MSTARVTERHTAPCSDQQLAELIEAVTRSQDEFDIERALAVAAQVERETENVELRMRARLLRQNALERKGEVGPAARLAWEVNRWAADHDHRDLLAQSHWQLSRSYHYLGDAASCLDHAVRAVELLDDDAPPLQRGRFVVTLADALGWAGSFEEARRRYASAEEIFISLGDVPRHIMVLNNLAYTEYEAGEPERAWAVAQRMQTLAAAHGMRLREIYHDVVARAQIGIGRPADAEQTLLGCLAGYAPAAEEADLLPELLLTLAESQRLCGGTDRAQATLDRCRTLCEQRGLAEVRVRVLKEQAELHAARRDFESAYATHKLFYTAAEALRSEQQEAQARIRAAMFETAEARQDAQRFFEQARRDPLTGLYNRRFVDERLPVLLAHAAQHGEPLAAALVDIDHFKRINDTFSHDVGDQVLAVVARVLAEGAGGEAVVARLGGEEFLLVLPGVTAETAGRRLEEVRLAVRSYPWQPITGELPVTISIGGAVALPDSTQSTLLSRADHHLYAAKNAGRDRVVLDS